VIAYSAAKDPGIDELTLDIPLSIAALGETDLWLRVDGRISNVGRIRLVPAARLNAPATAPKGPS
jgi:hypothetical protein